VDFAADVHFTHIYPYRDTLPTIGSRLCDGGWGLIKPGFGTARPVLSSPFPELVQESKKEVGKGQALPGGFRYDIGSSFVYMFRHEIETLNHIFKTKTTV
jgi:hypothetical protein